MDLEKGSLWNPFHMVATNQSIRPPLARVFLMDCVRAKSPGRELDRGASEILNRVVSLGLNEKERLKDV